ncbi:MAG: hypothetical protein KGI03_00850 [Patescibacteria group bacterium]|nr:hypothetical protein [Patescibacteria group bacterium]
MKVTVEKKHKFLFEMKDKSILPPIVVVAESEKEARAIVTDYLGQALDQLESADRAEANKEAKKEGKEPQASPASQG